MIITKTPFRVSFCGGGSDMADFYKEKEGCVLSTSINRYLYISIHPYFDERKTVLKYSKNEIVDSVKDIDHSIIRCVLQDMDIKGVEICSTADVPSGTGLGSSSSFTVGLLHTLYCFKGVYASKAKMAEQACKIEIEKLCNPIGKQDQYAAAFGGFNMITFHKDDTVSVEPIITELETLNTLQENLIMFYTGYTHDTKTILAEQKKNISQNGKAKNLIRMCKLAKEMKLALEQNNLSSFGDILNEGWMHKRELASGVSNPDINEMYEIAMANGATGGKLLGAGGGGFLLFYCEKYKQKHLEEALGLKKFNFRFEYDGTSVVHIGDKYL